MTMTSKTRATMTLAEAEQRYYAAYDGVVTEQMLDLDAPAIHEPVAYYATIVDLTPNRATVTRAYGSAAELRRAARRGAVGMVVSRSEPMEVGERIWLGTVAVADIPPEPRTLRAEIDRMAEGLRCRGWSQEVVDAQLDAHYALTDPADHPAITQRIAGARARWAARIAADRGAGGAS